MRYLFVFDSVRAFFFSLGREAHRSENCVNSLKTADFSLSTPLNNYIQILVSHLNCVVIDLSIF